MTRPLSARTPAGARMVELAEEHAADFATRAARYDAENTFVRENFAAMRASGFLAATAPAEAGGLGVDSLHDLTVAVSRLARGCPATAIAANMHLGFTFDISRTLRRSADDAPFTAQLRILVKLLGRGRLVMSHAGTEPGGAFSFPTTEARPADGGYLITGHKTFATNSAVADAFTVFVRVPDGAGWYRMGSAVIRRGTPGLTVLDNWDAVGMRGSGSNDVVLSDCFVPADMVQLGGRVGEPTTAMWPGLVAVNFPLVGAYLGIAEAAHELTVTAARTRKRKPYDHLLAERPAVQVQLAEMEVALATARATLGRTCEAMDEFLTLPEDELTMDAVHRAVMDYQCTKLIVNRAATEVVDQAMTVVGGGSYLTGHPLSRLYRDVRAGGFMQPYSPIEAREFIGRVSLGLDPFAELRTLVPAVPDAAPAGAGTTAESR
ncbi:acyl-CoA dehydrogenase family protein [Micromonospora echinaurantiaca]|uniref:acyl-CoA dehydrogenase family protein n=1 Tax=Micromonospora echinaurantiaca TaxID=47857 RepID=UPI0037898F21